jgi:hypothetical protein
VRPATVTAGTAATSAAQPDAQVTKKRKLILQNRQASPAPASQELETIPLPLRTRFLSRMMTRRQRLLAWPWSGRDVSFFSICLDYAMLICKVVGNTKFLIMLVSILIGPAPATRSSSSSQ